MSEQAKPITQATVDDVVKATAKELESRIYTVESRLKSQINDFEEKLNGRMDEFNQRLLDLVTMFERSTGVADRLMDMIEGQDRRLTRLENRVDKLENAVGA